MRAITSSLVALFASMMLAAGCSGSAPVTTSEPPIAETSAKNVRMSLTAQGSAQAFIHVIAKDKLTGAAACDRTIQVAAGATELVQIGIPAAGYTFLVEAFADAALTVSLGTSSTDANVELGVVTEIALVINTDIKAGAEGGIILGSNQAPTISDLTVDLDVGAGIAAELHVAAVDLDGKALHYFWSGFGLDGTVEGAATLTISAAAAAAATAAGEVQAITVLVVDDLGASALASIQLAIGASAQIGIGVGVSVDVGLKIEICLEAQAACAAACKVAAAASLNGAAALVQCVLQCGVKLATCEANASEGEGEGDDN